MAKKSDFSEAEWKLLINTPRYILLALRSADRTNLIAARSEENALNNYIEAYTSRSPLVRSVLEDQENVSRRLRTKNPLTYIERAGRLLNRKADDSSGAALRTLLLGSADAIANAVRESRKRNADHVSAKEAEMIAKIKDALKENEPRAKSTAKRSTASSSRRTTKPASRQGPQPAPEKAKATAAPTPRRTSRGGTSTRRQPTINRQPAANKPEPRVTIEREAPGPRPARASKTTRPTPPSAPPKPAPQPRTPRVMPSSAPNPAPKPKPAPQPNVAPRPNVAPPEPVVRPDPVVEPVRAAAPTDGTAIVTRWTNVYATPQPDSALDVGLAPNTPVTLLGRDEWGGWILVESAETSGWVPRDALNVESADGLMIVGVAESGGGAVAAAPAAATAPAAAVAPAAAEPEVVETMTISRWTNVFNAPQVGAATEVALEPGTRVVLLGASGIWMQIRHDGNQGWIPTDALG